METNEELVTRVQLAKSKVEQRRQTRLRTEAKMETLYNELEQLKTRLKALGIDPAELDTLLADQESKFEALLATLEDRLNVSTG
jgi:gamma-glutamylcysteine synthetase